MLGSLLARGSRILRRYIKVDGSVVQAGVYDVGAMPDVVYCQFVNRQFVDRQGADGPLVGRVLEAREDEDAERAAAARAPFERDHVVKLLVVPPVMIFGALRALASFMVSPPPTT